MTKQEALRQTRQADTLRSLGFTLAEAEALRRISMTLHQWFEHECNGTIQRDGDNGDGLPYWYSTQTGRKLSRVPDRERGAMKRLTAIIGQRNGRPCVVSDELRATDPRGPVSFYVQGDPRGAALYILRPGDVPDGADVSSYYSRGLCIY